MLNGIDAAFDVDSKLEEMGTEAFLRWVATETSGPFEKYASDKRSALRSYVEFSGAENTPELSGVADDDESPDQRLLFRLEQDMQAAVRRQLNELESGLVADDDGVERRVATGKIDIVARDKDKKLVVIELKAGPCPPTALEQVLGYADALAEETGEDVRAYLIAGEFADRTRAAARRTRGLKLKTYEFSVSFNDVDQQEG